MSSRISTPATGTTSSRFRSSLRRDRDRQPSGARSRSRRRRWRRQRAGRRANRRLCSWSETRLANESLPDGKEASQGLCGASGGACKIAAKREMEADALHALFCLDPDER